MNEEHKRELQEANERLKEAFAKMSISCEQAEKAMTDFGLALAKMNKIEESETKTLFSGIDPRKIAKVYKWPEGVTKEVAIQHIAEHRCPFCMTSGIDLDVENSKYMCSNCHAVFGPSGRVEG
jgi:hypothetical protein